MGLCPADRPFRVIPRVGLVLTESLYVGPNHRRIRSLLDLPERIRPIALALRDLAVAAEPRPPPCRRDRPFNVGIPREVGRSVHLSRWLLVDVPHVVPLVPIFAVSKSGDSKHSRAIRHRRIAAVGGCQIPKRPLRLVLRESLDLPEDLMFAWARLEHTMRLRHALGLQNAIHRLWTANVDVQVNVPDLIDVRLRTAGRTIPQRVRREVDVAAV